MACFIVPRFRTVIQRFVPAAVAVLSLAFFANQTFASNWEPGGVCLSGALDAQQYPAIASDGAGGAIVTWADRRTGEYDIYAQRVSSEGVPLWTADGVPVSTWAGDQKTPFVTTDGSGGVIVVWTDERSGEADIYAQRLDASGNPLWTDGGRPICTATYKQMDTEILSDGNGGAIVIWRDFRGGTPSKLFAQKLTAAGGTAWASQGVQISSASNQYVASLLADGSGGAFIAWYDYRNANFDIFAQHLSTSGTLTWPAAGLPVCTAPGEQNRPRMTSDGSGGIILTWYDRRGPNFDIYAQRVTAGGSIAAGWPVNGAAVCTASNDQAEPVLVSNGQGGAIITWYDNRGIVSVYAQNMTASGGVTPGWPVNGLRLCQSPATRPAIMPDGAGGAIVAWHGTPGQTNMDVSVQRVTAAGLIPEGWPSDGLYLCTAPGDQSRPAGIDLPGGDALITWSDGRTGDGGDIYVSRVGAAFPNLNAVLPPSGFAFPVVPRNGGGATLANVSPTPALDGGLPTTQLSWAVVQEGSGSVPTWTGRVLLDGLVVRSNQFSGIPETGFHTVLNDGPLTVRGGRHTLTLDADFEGRVTESIEGDNSWSAQFVWSPMTVLPGQGSIQPPPPVRGSGPLPNLDGFRFTPSAGTSWVCAVAPIRAGDDFSLAVYDDYSGSQSGFENERAATSAAAGATRFLVGQGSGNPATVYPATLRNSLTTTAGYVMDQADAAGRGSSSMIEQWVEQVMPMNRLADVYEADLVAGQTYYINLVKKWGPGNMAFRIFPAGSGGVFGPGDALVISEVRTADGSDIDVAEFTPLVSGRYPVVVYRQDGEHFDEPLTYHFFWSNAVSAAGDETPHRLAFAGASPNPMRSRASLQFEMPEAGAARLTIYDVSGRVVRSLLDQVRPAGEHQLTWDGRADDGTEVGGGMYWARFEAAGKAITRKVVVMP